MPKKVLFNLLLSVFMSASLFAATVSAQANSCAMKLEVTRSNSETRITGATATAVNNRTKRVYRSALRGGMPYFAKLPDGGYRVTVTKIGFSRSVDDFNLDCSEAANEFLIELHKGSPAKIVRLYNRERILKAPPLRRTEASEYSIGETNTANMGSYQDDPNGSKTISGGVVNGKATNLVKPPYPAAARAVRASGAVNVQVTIDEQGNVYRAVAVSGHPLLRAAAVQAARASTFSPTLLQGQPVKVTGIIVYNFVP
jgi:TonB family protein